MNHVFAYKSTLLGFGALMIWSVMALVLSELTGLPTFQTVACTFAVTFSILAIKLTIKKQWHLVKQPLWVWALGVLGICGGDYFYMAAFKYAPPAHIDFIDYLWPFWMVVLARFFPRETFTWQQMVGGLLCIVGIYLLLVSSSTAAMVGWGHARGYCLALFGSLAWSVYNLVSRYAERAIPLEMYGMYAGVGAVMGLLCHCYHEVWVMPSVYEAALTALMGCFALAYLLWDYGTKFGDIKLLSLLAYFTPVMSMTLLILCGKQAFSYVLILSCFFVISGVLIGSMDWSELRQKWVRKKPEP